MYETVEQNSTEGCSFCLPWKNFGETMKSTQYYIIFIFYAILENVIIFVRVWLLDEKYSSFRTHLFLYENDANRVCAAVQKSFTP